MVWLIRVLVIGSFSIAGDRLFSQAESRSVQRPFRQALQPVNPLAASGRPPISTPFRPASKLARPESTLARPEPTYHNISMGAKPVREAEYVDASRRS
jgi:hypothetical protein